jgi:dsRNA-specific ribonuclease
MSAEGKTDMSTKVLADVMEDLIGASMVDCGFPKALQPLRLFLDKLKWQSLATRRAFL